jgi:hypothetical protein
VSGARREGGGARPLVERVARRELHTAIIYRRAGGLVWHDGTTDDVSEGGVRFHGERHLPVESPVELSFRLPPDFQRKGEGSVYCWGKVVRTELSPAGDPRPALAVKIVRYRSTPRSVSDVRRVIGEVRGPLDREARVSSRQFH